MLSCSCLRTEPDRRRVYIEPQVNEPIQVEQRGVAPVIASETMVREEIDYSRCLPMSLVATATPSAVITFALLEPSQLSCFLACCITTLSSLGTTVYCCTQGIPTRDVPVSRPADIESIHGR